MNKPTLKQIILFCKAHGITNTQTIQAPKFLYTQYMGHSQKNDFFWALTHTNPNCNLFANNDKNMWPHLLSTCTNQNIKLLDKTKLCILSHKCYKPTRALDSSQSQTQEHKLTILEWLLACYCNNKPWQCMARLRHDMICIVGAPNQSHTLETPSRKLTIQLIALHIVINES